MAFTRRLFALVLCLLLVSVGAAVIAAPDSTPPPGEQTGLVLWNLPLRPAYSAGHAANLKIVDDFLATYPDIRIEAGGGPQLQRFGRGTREFLMSQAAGIAPDVVEMSDVDLQDFISRNFLLPMNPYLKNAGKLDDALKNPFARQFVKDGNVYALPMSARPTGYMLVYRKDQFKRAGLDPEKPPKTWDEFLKCAEALTDPANEQYGFVLPTIETKGPLEAGGFVELLFALNGVEVIKQGKDGRWVADFADNPKALQAMEFLKTLLGKKVVRDNKNYRGLTITSAGTVDDLIVYSNYGGNMAFQQVNGDILRAHMVRGCPVDAIGITLLPLGPGGGGYRPIYTRYLGINSLCPTEDRRQAGYEWVQFNRRPQNLVSYAKGMVEWGMANFANPQDLQQDPSLKDFAREVPPGFAAAYASQFEGTKVLPICPDHRRLRLDYLARIIWELQKNPDTDVKALMSETEEKINREVLGILPPTAMAGRRNIALVVVIVVGVLIVAGAFIGLRGMAKSLKEETRPGAAARQAGIRKVYLLAAVFIIPAAGSVLLWMYIPLVRGALIAFQDYQIVGPITWAGLNNFVDVLTDQLFWVSLLRTLQYAVISLSLGFVSPIIVAFLLSEVPRGKILYRVLYYLPSLTPALVISFLWFWIYNPGPTGFLNTLIANFGNLFGQEWGPYKYIDSESLAMICVILPSIWAGLGAGSIIYLAALHGVPDEMYEAADLDGATPWNKVWHVSLPFIKPLVLISFVGAVIGTFYATQSIFVMTMGGPGNATYVTGLYIFFNSFVWLKFGKATAAAWILGSLLIGFMVYQLRVLRDMRFQTAPTKEGE